MVKISVFQVWNNIREDEMREGGLQVLEAKMSVL